jgi:hypothetical protein
MHNKYWLPVAGIVALGFMAIPTGAAPLGGVGSFSTAVNRHRRSLVWAGSRQP